MPTYEYHCTKCDKTFDLFQSMADAALTVCPREVCEQPKWGKGKVKRQIGLGAGLIFKGSGFYITDYRSEKYKEAAKKDAPPATASAGSKPAADKPAAAPKKEAANAKTSATKA